MTNTEKRSLYESIMKEVSQTVKSHINNEVFEKFEDFDSYDPTFSNIKSLKKDAMGQIALMVAVYAKLWQEGKTKVCLSLRALANEALVNDDVEQKLEQFTGKTIFQKRIDRFETEKNNYKI
jgi:hypothetical protein